MDDAQELIEHTYPAGTVFHITGIPVQLVGDAAFRLCAANLELTAKTSGLTVTCEQRFSPEGQVRRAEVLLANPLL